MDSGLFKTRNVIVVLLLVAVIFFILLNVALFRKADYIRSSRSSCEFLNQGDVCGRSFKGEVVNGTCEVRGENVLICVPPKNLTRIDFLPGFFF